MFQDLSQRDDLRTMGELRPKSIAIVLGTRPEIIKLGQVIRQFGPAARGTFARLVSTDQSMVDESEDWLESPDEAHVELSRLDTPFGDGSASSRSVGALVDLIGTTKDQRHQLIRTPATLLT